MGRVIPPELEALRRKIDEVDCRILSLIAERVRIVLEVGDIKRAHDIHAYDPERERALIDKLIRLAEPPLDAPTVQHVFERLIDESRRLEQRHMSAPSRDD